LALLHPLKGKSLQDSRADSDWGREMVRGSTATFTALSLATFIVTAVVALVTRAEHWPGGYWPWMLSLGFLLFAIACYLNSLTFMRQRDAARTERNELQDEIQYSLEFLYITSSQITQDVASPNCLIPFQMKFDVQEPRSSRP